jgi:CRP-like cAMP-binding protein
VAEVREWQFVGEMSFLTDKAATADVVAIEPTRYVDWPRAALREFLTKNPSLVAPMRLVIGTDLIVKLNRPPAGKSSRAEQGV